LNVQWSYYDRKHRKDGKEQSLWRQGESFSKETYNHSYYENKKRKTNHNKKFNTITNKNTNAILNTQTF